MLSKLKQRKDSGFTIIEVLIVLAIAGLIMLVVFLAVPALNRNADNNQIKTEANNLMSAYNELTADNGGTPTTDGAGVQKAANTKTIQSVSIVSAALTSDPGDTTKATFITGQSCVAQLGFATSTGANISTRAAALVYDLQKAGGGTTVQCIDTK